MSTSSSAATPAKSEQSASSRQPSAVETSPFPYAEAELDDAGNLQHGSDDGVEKARRLQAQAFEQGRKNAEDRLQAETQAALEQQRQQILAAIDNFAKERQSYYQRIEPEVVELALAIARKILHREAQVDAHALAGMVHVTLEKLDAGTEIHLHVHPRDAAEWRHYFACQVREGPAPEVHEDPQLGIGECRLETATGTTQIGFESQLKEIETGLLDLLSERPGSGAGSS